MEQFFYQFVSWFESLFTLLNSYKFQMFGYSVSYLAIMIAMIIISFAITVFWKGARG